jgi:hypothetical protein
LAFPLRAADEIPEDALGPSGWRVVPLAIQREGFTVDG